MNFDIEFINDTEPTVDYDEQATNEYETNGTPVIEKYTEIFESDYNVEDGEDIGGLIVYGKEGKLQAVYDYENFCGWVV
jgi:Mg2+/Co2+ transporter CorC